MYVLIGIGAVVAIVVGVRRNSPDDAPAWYLMAAGNGALVLGDALRAWSRNAPDLALPSLVAVLPFFAGFPLIAAGTLLLVRHRGRERRPTALIDTAILSVGLGLAFWVILVQPALVADGALLDRIIGVAYPVGDGLVFAIVIRLATAPGVWNRAAGLFAASVAAWLTADVLFQVGTFIPDVQVRELALAPLWLLGYVLWGACALQPSTRELSARGHSRSETVQASRIVALAAAVMIGPAIIALELINGVPLHAWSVVIATIVLALLIFLRMIRMVRQLQDQANRLGQLAETDYVTGLANRRRFDDALAALLDDPRHPVARLMLVDVERFAELADSLGHRTGDAILHAVGARLTALVDRRCLVARIGENTFAVLEPEIEVDHDGGLMSALLRKALEQPLGLAGLNVAVEVTIGALTVAADCTDPILALHRADVALSAAKVRPDRVADYGTEMETGDTLAPLLIGELRGALDAGQIVLHYQPQVDLRTGLVFGVEALARWEHPRHGLLGPDSFITAAERTGVIGAFTQNVLDQALAQARRWKLDGLDLTVAVNLSVLNLLDPGLVADVHAALRRYNLDPSALELEIEIEITESSAMVDPRRSVQVLGTLAELGITLSIDDYGTGHSSLTYLQRLPVGRLKIDRSFVAKILTDDASAAIVASTIDLARQLSLEVIAEGVEDDDTLLALRDLRCFAVQGFGLSRPVAADSILDVITQLEDRLPAVLATPVKLKPRSGSDRRGVVRSG